eukprot:5458844-Pyramimonas_sp.AAC.1
MIARRKELTDQLALMPRDINQRHAQLHHDFRHSLKQHDAKIKTLRMEFSSSRELMDTCTSQSEIDAKLDAKRADIAQQLSALQGAQRSANKMLESIRPP